MSRVINLTALENALFGIDWDAEVCARRLQALAACSADDPLRSHHLHCAIDALQGAHASLASAERFVSHLRTVRNPKSAIRNPQ